MRAEHLADGRVRVTLLAGDTLGVGVGPGEMLVTPEPGLTAWDELVERGIPIDPAVPGTITDRQFAHGLWRQNVITLEEAKAFVKVGELPATLAEIVAGLPAGMRDDVDLMLSGATTFDRAHPAVATIAAAFGWTDEVLDEFWRFAATL